MCGGILSINSDKINICTFLLHIITRACIETPPLFTFSIIDACKQRVWGASTCVFCRYFLNLWDFCEIGCASVFLRLGLINCMLFAAFELKQKARMLGECADGMRDSLFFAKPAKPSASSVQFLVQCIKWVHPSFILFVLRAFRRWWVLLNCNVIKVLFK